ncbi:DnaJ domain-containing protein [uncultured Gilvimarinus sp.]|uniref:J domain-containing protein n=1 Tax=uncultured Gilvimarinus sp. TaxID=1689143 RepID=UPI0030EB9354|tara:strand:- start:1373 stop:2017 length:645 start_codon:yes stop_codon:yes gene_type:complete
MSLYDVLGVAKDATKQAIKTAYRSLAQKAHPDREGGDAEKFHEIQLAYDVLSDDGKRERYDATGETEERASARSEAETLIMQRFAQSIEEDDDDDLVETLKTFLSTGKIQVELTINQANDALKKLERHQGRVKCNDGDNLFAMVLDQKINHKKRDIETLSGQLEVIKEAELIVAEYTDTAEREPQPSQSAYFAEAMHAARQHGNGRRFNYPWGL